ncbi:MAG: hypothetical protein HOO06_05885 [Bdellovibrionaceae bacterium]|nr:hypothetical protein [Pseudobdellovibrionaceae bacterium]
MKILFGILLTLSFAQAAQSETFKTQYTGAEADKLISNIIELESQGLVEYMSYDSFSTNESAVSDEYLRDSWMIFELNLNGKTISCESHTYMTMGEISQELPQNSKECSVN